MLKFAMAAVIALVSGSAQAQVTGGNVLNNSKPNTYSSAGNTPWLPTGANESFGSFHAGGVAACDGCHVMHNANNGNIRSTAVAPWSNAVPAFLLQGSDQSSTCLLCHGSASTSVGLGASATPFVMTNTSTTASYMQYTPGGDFGWLKIGGTKEPSLNSHGHNVVASDFGFAADSRVAPGGTYKGAADGSGAFACSNCHDPHGRYRMQGDSATWNWAYPGGTGTAAINQPIYSSGSYGNPPTATGAVGSYRLLAGRGYVPASNVANPFPFPNNPPVAVAPLGYNKQEAGGGVQEVRVAYGSGMSEWCQNCHTNIHLDNYVSGAMNATGQRHPAGSDAFLKIDQANVYNTYVSSGKWAANQQRYTSLVPFESANKIKYDGVGGKTPDLAILAAATAPGADPVIFKASTDSNVMCLSCHRAHASAFAGMTRWNVDDTFITNGTSGYVDTQGRGTTLLTAGYYGRAAGEFGSFQRSLCNKCHGKD
ncbi:MAG: cytochrome C [Deltaproteobacteria bacterium]